MPRTKYLLLAVAAVICLAGFNWWHAPVHQPVESTAYYKARRSFFAVLDVPKCATLFAGDSLTEHGEWTELLGDTSVVNFGIAGDTTRGLLLRTSDITHRRPCSLFLMVGINDLTAADEVDPIETFRHIVQAVHAGSPATRIFVQSVLPTALGAKVNQRVIAFNAELRQLAAGSGATFIDMHDAFAAPDGRLASRYTFDGLHLSGAGYALWTEKVRHFIEPRTGTPPQACQ